MHNYILVRVEEPDSDESSTKFATRTAFLRRIIHEVAQEYGISVSDNIIRSDRSNYPWGAKVPLEEAENLFDKIMYRGSL